MADPKDKIINELTSRLASTEQGLQHALTEISKLVKRIDQHDKDLDEQDEELNEHLDAMKTLRVQIASRAQQELMGGKHSTPSTAKRPQHLCVRERQRAACGRPTPVAFCVV